MLGARESEEQGVLEKSSSHTVFISMHNSPRHIVGAQ